MCSQMADPSDAFPFDDADTASTPDPLPALDGGTAPTVEVDDLRRAIRDAAITTASRPTLAETAASTLIVHEEVCAPEPDIEQTARSSAPQTMPHEQPSSDATDLTQPSTGSSLTFLSSALLSIPGVTTIANMLSSVGRFVTNLVASPKVKETTAPSENRVAYIHHLITEPLSFFARVNSLCHEVRPKNFFLEAIESLYDSLKAIAQGQRASQQLAEAALEAEFETKKKNRAREERERLEESEARDRVRAIDAVNCSSNGETPYITAKVGGAFFSVEEAIRMARDAEQREEQKDQNR